MTEIAHCFLLFTAKCGSDADQRLGQAEVLIEEILEPAGGTVRIGPAWAVCDAPDEPGCCEYTADLVLEWDASTQDDPGAGLEELLRNTGFKLCRPAATPAEWHISSLAA